MEGNIGIKFYEMNADSVVHKLCFIEKDSKKIWKAFDEYYGYGFFFDVIESEFGITPETKTNLINRFNIEIENYKTEAERKIV
jgi:hypothetical protein